jgi:hypothetical protein
MSATSLPTRPYPTTRTFDRALWSWSIEGCLALTLVERPSAAQQQQAGDHLQVVRQPVMALLGQERLPANFLILLAKQHFVARESLS